MSNFKQIQAFLMVVREESFTKAAENLKVSKATVSKLVSALETDLGRLLLTRITKKVLLTKAGAKYAQSCREVFLLLVEAEVAAQTAFNNLNKKRAR